MNIHVSFLYSNRSKEELSCLCKKHLIILGVSFHDSDNFSDWISLTKWTVMPWADELSGQDVPEHANAFLQCTRWTKRPPTHPTQKSSRRHSSHPGFPLFQDSWSVSCFQIYFAPMLCNCFLWWEGSRWWDRALARGIDIFNSPFPLFVSGFRCMITVTSPCCGLSLAQAARPWQEGKSSLPTGWSFGQKTGMATSISWWAGETHQVQGSWQSPWSLLMASKVLTGGPSLWPKGLSVR